MVYREQPVSSEQTERLVAGLFEEPDVPGIQLVDPRFRWVRKTYPGIPRKAVTLGAAIEASLAQPPERAPFLETLLEHLVDYTADLRKGMLEDELLGIVAALSPARNTAPMLARLGWAGVEPVTLQEAAALVGLTRERIRQIEGRIERVCAERPVWTPVLDQALAVAANHSPMTQAAFAMQLRQSGLTALDSFSIEGLVTAQNVFGKSRRVEARQWQGASILFRVGGPEGEDFVELLDAIRTAALKLIGNQGMATVAEVVERLSADDCEVKPTGVLQALRLCDSVVVVEDQWLFHPTTDSRNPLFHRLDKMLMFYPDLPVPIALAQLARNQRENHRYMPTEAALAAFADWHPAYGIDEGRISRRQPIPGEGVLSEGELAITRYILACDEPPDFTNIVRDLERPGLSRVSIAVILGQSPIIHRYGFRKTYRYALLTPATLGREFDEADIDDDLAGLVDAQVLDEPVPVGEAGNDPEPLEQPDAVEIPEHDDDASIHTGVEADAYPPLEVALRKMLSVYSPLPIVIARVQLRRQPGLVGDDVEAEISALAHELEDFIVDGDRIRLRPHLTLRPEEELGRDELIVYRAIRNAGNPLRDEVVPRHYGGDATVPALERRQVLRESCVIVALDGERYEALRDCHAVGEHFQRLHDGDKDASSGSIGTVPADPHRDVPGDDSGRSNGLESAAVRARIEAEFYRLAQGTGLARVDELIRELGDGRIVQVGPVQLRSILGRIDGLVELPDGWIASVADRSRSPLTKFLRRMVAVYHNLPLDLATAQLKRQKAAYAALAESQVRAFVSEHPDLDIVDDRIRARAAFGLKETDELSRDERVIHQAIRNARKPLTEASILAHTRYGAVVSPMKLKTELRESCVLVPMGDGTFDALQPSTRLRQFVLDGHTAPDVAVIDIPSVLAVSDIDGPLLEATESPARDGAPIAPESLPALLTIDDAPDVPLDQEHGRTETLLWPLTDILAKVRADQLVLPEIQRGYVWKTTQVRDLVDSLYRGFPIGTMLVWSTNEVLRARSLGDASRSPGVPVDSATNYLLDGQQRITSLSKVRAGEVQILFNPLREEFATASVTNRRSPLFIAVADVWHGGIDTVWPELAPHVPVEEHAPVRERLARLSALLHRAVSVDMLHNFSYEEVTNIFVRVNSRGTRLKAAELAIAQIAQRLPNMISDDVAAYVATLNRRGWQFDDQFLLRCLTAVARDRSSFKHLVSMDRADVTASWARLVPAMDAWLELLGDRLGLTSMDFIASAHSHIVPVAWITSEPKRLLEDKLLEWFVQSQVWSRYTGLGESALDADLQRLRGARSGNPFPGLSQNLRASGQSARVTQGDLQAASRQSSLRLLMYLAARNAGARDLFTGGGLGSTSQRVVMQPIFPSTAIRRQAPAREANELANYVLLAQDVKATKPTGDIFRYLPDVPHSRLVDAAIPTDPALWEPSRFRDFIKERRRLVAAPMNEALKALAGAPTMESDGRIEPDIPAWSRLETEMALD